MEPMADGQVKGSGGMARSTANHTHTGRYARGMAGDAREVGPLALTPQGPPQVLPTPHSDWPVVSEAAMRSGRRTN